MFLKDATPCTIWTAKKFAIGRVTPRFLNLWEANSLEKVNNTLLAHLFPSKLLPIVPTILSPYQGYMPLMASEITLALRKCSSSSALGPDTIPQTVWKRVHLVSPQLLTDLLDPLIKFEYHPTSMKKANGVVLNKPGKLSYDTPSSFRVIGLLQTVSKILDRIVTSRLSRGSYVSQVAQSQPVWFPPPLSSFDAVLSLVDIVRTMQHTGLKVPSLFWDIKRGFDNVNVSILCSSLKWAGVPYYMVTWIRTFLSQRTCHIQFQDAWKSFSPVQVGTHQGSLISPLLFSIYVASVHIHLSNGLTISSIYEFALSTASLSYRTNIRVLQKAFGSIRAHANASEVGFSVPKTELIRRRTLLQKDPSGCHAPPLICLDGQIFPLLPFITWLGYWLTPNLSTTAHLSKRLGLAYGALAKVKRLSPPRSGLSPYLSPRLAISLLLSRLLYGVDLMTPSNGLYQKMDVYWHQDQR